MYHARGYYRITDNAFGDTTQASEGIAIQQKAHPRPNKNVGQQHTPPPPRTHRHLVRVRSAVVPCIHTRTYEHTHACTQSARGNVLLRRALAQIKSNQIKCISSRMNPALSGRTLHKRGALGHAHGAVRCCQLPLRVARVRGTACTRSRPLPPRPPPPPPPPPPPRCRSRCAHLRLEYSTWLSGSASIACRGGDARQAHTTAATGPARRRRRRRRSRAERTAVYFSTACGNWLRLKKSLPSLRRGKFRPRAHA